MADYISRHEGVVIDDAVDIAHEHANIDILNATEEAFLTEHKEKLDNITITAPIDLDALKTAVENLDTGIVTLKGNFNASLGSFPPGAKKGWTYIITTGGVIDNILFYAGEKITALLDSASTTTFEGNWYCVEPKAPIIDGGSF